jgi:hypothetical protein
MMAMAWARSGHNKMAREIKESGRSTAMQRKGQEEVYWR